MVDSETGLVQGIAVGSDNNALYQRLLNDHNARVRQHCLSHQVSFLSTVAGPEESIEESALATISRMGLFV
jgi:hypothetical protein